MVIMNMAIIFVVTVIKEVNTAFLFAHNVEVKMGMFV